MKKTFVILMTVLMSISASAFVGTKSNVSENLRPSTAAGVTIPVNLIVKQIVTFKDGSTINVYYQKEGNICKLYSTVDVTKYKESDLNRVKSTSFEIADHVEGKCYMTKKTSDIISLAKSVFRQLQ